MPPLEGKIQFKKTTKAINTENFNWYVVCNLAHYFPDKWQVRIEQNLFNCLSLSMYYLIVGIDKKAMAFRIFTLLTTTFKQEIPT